MYAHEKPRASRNASEVNHGGVDAYFMTRGRNRKADEADSCSSGTCLPSPSLILDELPQSVRPAMG